MARPLRMGPLMRIPPSLKLMAGMWIAALLGALAGRTLAEASSMHAPAAARVSSDGVGVR
jgi:hypothetical protein